MLTAEHVDPASATGEVNHLLPRNLTRTDADAFTLNAVIAAKQQMARVRQAGGECLLDEADLQSQRFQPAQRMFGLVQVVYFSLYGS
jgi:hypothetical protein